MVEVLVNVAFTDKYTNETYEANSKIVISEERATEIKNFDKNLIIILGEAKKKTKTTSKKEEK